MEKNNTLDKKIICFLILGFLILVLITHILVMKKNTKITISYAHLSFDDTIKVFEDLTENQNEYNSVFDNDLLKCLKSLHDEFGATFSLYCYNREGDFDLTMVPTRYARDFRDNSSWLKFGFHSPTSDIINVDLSLEQSNSEYEFFIREFLRITDNGVECLDLIPRLHYFSGTKENLLSLAKMENGPIGFLSTDDDSQSYYLSKKDSRYINANDIFQDENGIYFISTDLRLDTCDDVPSALKAIQKSKKQNSIAEIFAHEWAMYDVLEQKLRETCIWANECGYEWSFAMNLVD